MADAFSSIQNYISNNHILAPLLLCLVFSLLLIFIKIPASSEPANEVQTALNKQRGLLFYSLVSAILLLIPISVFILRKFQTVFFGYDYLWALVPIIPVTAFALTCMSGFLKSIAKKKAAFVCIAAAAILFICGSMGYFQYNEQDYPDLKVADTSFEESMPVLEKLESMAKGSAEDFIILAPPSVTEYSRLYSGDIKTLFGRDMWNGSLAPYNYTVYSEEIKDLYYWMLYEDSYGAIYYTTPRAVTTFNYEGLDYDAFDKDPESFGGINFIKRAKELGVSCIVFTINEKTDKAAITHIEEVTGLAGEFIKVEATYDEGYYILPIRAF